jgi:hypothetical protein
VTGNIVGSAVSATGLTVTGLITKVPSAVLDILTVDTTNTIALTHSIMRLNAEEKAETLDATPLISTTAYAQGTSVVLYNAGTNAITIQDNSDESGNLISTISGGNLVLAAGKGVRFVLIGDRWRQQGSLYETDNITLSGNLSADGNLTIGGVAGIDGVVTLDNLTASRAVFTGASKELVSVDTTGTGNVVRAISPTLTGTLAAADITASGTAVITGTAQAATMRLAVDLDPASAPAAAGIIGIDASFNVYVSTGTGEGAWVKIGDQGE